MKRPVVTAVVLMMVFAMVLSACAPAAMPTPARVVKKVVTKEVQTVVTKEVVKEVQVTPTPAPVAAGTLPRNETMYFNGQQWGPVVGWNPYSNSNNNALGIAQQDNARVVMFETPYLYNMLDGKEYPLLADGDYTVERCADRDHLQAQARGQMERWHAGDRRGCRLYLGHRMSSTIPLSALRIRITSTPSRPRIPRRL